MAAAPRRVAAVALAVLASGVPSGAWAFVAPARGASGAGWAAAGAPGVGGAGRLAAPGLEISPPRAVAGAVPWRGALLGAFLAAGFAAQRRSINVGMRYQNIRRLKDGSNIKGTKRRIPWKQNSMQRNAPWTSDWVGFTRLGYGGRPGPWRKEKLVCFGPQYTGPAPDYSIIHNWDIYKSRHGERRVIPKLSGSWERRRHIMRALTTDLIRYGRIKTRLARARAVRSFVDRMIVIAKRGDDLSRREAGEWMYDQKLVDNLFKQARDRYPDQNKDFVVVTETNMGPKGEQMAYAELV